MSIEKTVEKSLHNFWEHMESGDFSQCLKVFSKMGFSAVTMNFVMNPDSYYVPNKRGNVFIAPKNTSDDLIPIVGIADERTYELKKPAVHRLQSAAIIGAGLDINYISKQFADNSTISSSGGAPGTASVFTQQLVLAESGLTVESAPSIIFNLDNDSNSHAPTCPSIILHELVHAAQSLQNPVYEDNPRLKREFEAYAVQAPLVDSVTVPYSSAIAMAGEVNMFRIKNLGETNYEPTAPVRRDVNNHPLLKNIIRH